jgi:hypothetical protein
MAAHLEIYPQIIKITFKGTGCQGDLRRGRIYPEPAFSLDASVLTYVESHVTYSRK